LLRFALIYDQTPTKNPLPCRGSVKIIVLPELVVPADAVALHVAAAARSRCLIRPTIRLAVQSLILSFS